MTVSRPDAEDLAPPPAAEQAADQAARQQPPPPAESGVLDTVSTVVEGVSDAADVVGSVLSIFDV
jgi:hypothetical protein